MRLRALTPSRKSILIAASVAASLALSAVPAAASTSPAPTPAPTVVAQTQPTERPADQNASYFLSVAEGTASLAAGKVSTADLTAQMDALAHSERLSPAVVHILIGMLRESTAEVAQQVAAYDAAQAAKERARKAAEAKAKAAAAAKAAKAAKAAAAARAQQEAQAQRQAAASATASTPAAPAPAPASSGNAAPVSAPGGSPRAIAQQMMASRYGWGADQFQCLNSLWNRESGWNVHASNPSGAYGIPQALPGSKMGPGWQNSASAQISWGLGYIQSRYGTPCGAWGHSQATGWY